MLEQSQKLTDGLIIYSVLVSNYEKLDFKNDALAGVRANYFNSGNKEQKEITEIEIHGREYKLSYLMQNDEPLSWKVTRDNLSYQSVKRATGGVYSVISYSEKGIVYKRQYFDKNHIWLRTEYYDKTISNKLLTRIYPRKLSGITALVVEDIDKNGVTAVKTLFPSDTNADADTRVLIYSNVGMLWYDESFLPSDMPFTEKKSYGNSGFVFNQDLFSDSVDSANAFNLEDAAYLSDADIPQISSETNTESHKNYSAYDIIEKILVEAHKTNKDLFGEIINHTADEDFASNSNDEEIDTKSDIITDAEDSTAVGENEIYVNDEIKTETIVPETNEEPESDILDNRDSSGKTDINSDEKKSGRVVGAHFRKDEEPDAALEIEENNETVSDDDQHSDMVILTKSGKYTYYGELDGNGCRTGRGRTVSPDGLTSYDGEYQNDKRNGFGVCYYKNGSINYVGNWSDNIRSGSGVGYRLSDGTMHAGRWNNNTPDGYGARFDNDGNLIDVCMYENGARKGKSISFDENGNIVVSVYENGEKVSEFIVDTEV